MSKDFIPNKLSFDRAGYMKEMKECINIALNHLSRSAIRMMQDEIMRNGNGSHDMKHTAIEQVKELSRTITDTEVELVVGIDEDSLGDFGSQVFVRTMVVLHGNIASGPLMTKPGQMTWKKNVENYSMSPATNKDGSTRKPHLLPNGLAKDRKGMVWIDMVNGFGAKQHMLDNIFEKGISALLRDYENSLNDLINSIDYSKYLIVTAG